MSEQDLSSFLFERSDIEVLDIKFLRGRDPGLTAEELCAVAKGVLENFFTLPTASQLPEGRTAQRNVAELLGS